MSIDWSRTNEQIAKMSIQGFFLTSFAANSSPSLHRDVKQEYKALENFEILLVANDGKILGSLRSLLTYNLEAVVTHRSAFFSVSSLKRLRRGLAIHPY